MTNERESRPDILWHYTTTASLISIIKDRCIWATDAMYLNDSREVIEGAERLAAQAGAALTDPPSASSVQRLWVEIQRTLGGDATVELPERGPYIACFCEQGDLLSQWRGYASGNGYAIGLSASSLATLAESQGGQLAPAIYHDLDPSDRALFEDSMLTVGERGSRIIVSPLELARYKHRAFGEEQEWRVILPSGDPKDVSSDRGLMFRSGALGVVPYIAIHFEQEAVVNVNIGPGGDRVLRRRAVERLLAAVGMVARVECSEAPFRG